MTRSEIRTMIKRTGFKVPGNYVHLVNTRNHRQSLVRWNSMNFMKSRETCVLLNDRSYRFRNTSSGWVVDISCPHEEFDRWANSRDYSDVDIVVFSKFCKMIMNNNNVESVLKECFGASFTNSWLNVNNEVNREKNIMLCTGDTNNGMRICPAI